MTTLQALRAADDLRNIAYASHPRDKDLLTTLAGYVEAQTFIPQDLRDSYFKWLNGTQRQNRFGT